MKDKILVFFFNSYHKCGLLGQLTQLTSKPQPSPARNMCRSDEQSGWLPKSLAGGWEGCSLSPGDGHTQRHCLGAGS